MLYYHFSSFLNKNKLKLFDALHSNCYRFKSIVNNLFDVNSG